MSALRHEQLQRIFTRAARLGRGERTAFLDDACAGDTELHAEVLELLAADAEGDTLLDGAGGALLLADALTQEGALEPAPLPERIGRYRILRVINHGGMGVVYEAEEDHPRRRVALKVVRAWMVTDELLRRFRNEARVLGHLQHPGIARIYEAGTAETGAGAQPYFAMELVEGEPLDRYAESHGLDVAARLELVARLCDVLQFAHHKGVIHRDLKPANILVTTEAASTDSLRGTSAAPLQTARPKILDFGVARTTEVDLRAVTLQTSEGQLVGTVPYMSPEQASGDPAAIDARSDVYAVGVLAYELLTGRLPYEVHGRLVHDAVRIIREEEPSSLGTIDRALRGDVETIVAKALEKDRERRYRSAAALAADIRRHLRHEPIEARAASAIYQLRKFARRNKALVSGVAATLVVAVTGAVVATHYAVQAAARADTLERANYVYGIGAASSALDQQDYDGATAHLDRLPAAQRGWEYDYLHARLVHHEREWDAPARVATTPVFDREGRRMYAMMEDGALGTWDAASGRLVERRSLGGVHLPTAALHGPSGRFAVPTADGGVSIGDLAGGETARIEPDPSGRGPGILVWDHAGRRLLHFAPHPLVWDGAESRVLTEEEFAVGAFDHAGGRVALAAGGRLALLDAETGAVLARGVIDDVVECLAFAPDDTRLAVAGHYRNAYLLDPDSLELRARLTGHHDIVDGLAWSPDGSQLITTAEDGTVRVWSAAQPGAAIVYASGMAGLARVAVTPDGERIVVAGEHLRSFPRGDPDVLRGHSTYVYFVGFSPDGSLLATSGFHDPWIHVWDVRRGALLRRLQGPDRGYDDRLGQAPLVAFSEDGRRLVAATNDATAQWDLGSGAALPVPSRPPPVERFLETLGRPFWGPSGETARSPDHRRLACCDEPELGVVGLYELLPRAPSEAGGPGRFESETVGSPGALVGRLEGHVGQVHCAAFSPDGARIATGGNDASVRIWDARTCELLLVLRGHQQYVKHVAFSSDGTLLASASGDTTVRLWDTKTLHERRAMPGARGPAGQ